MASDMSGFQGPDGAQRWMAASGGDMAAYNREMRDWQNAQNPAGASNPSIQQLQQQAQAAGASEDFARFQQADAERWGPYYDAAASQAAGRPQFRSSRGAPGVYDKPTECPGGQGPSGPNETDPCTTTGYSTPNPWEEGYGGGKGGAGGAAAAPTDPNYFNPDDPLQAKLLELMQSGGGSFAGINAGGFTKGGGAIWSTPTAPTAAGVPAAASPAATPTSASAPTPSTGSGNAALLSATLNAFNPSGAQSTNYAPSHATVGASNPTPTPTPAPAAAAPVPAALQNIALPQRAQTLEDPNAWWKTNRAM